MRNLAFRGRQAALFAGKAERPDGKRAVFVCLERAKNRFSAALGRFFALSIPHIAVSVL